MTNSFEEFVEQLQEKAETSKDVDLGSVVLSIVPEDLSRFAKTMMNAVTSFANKATHMVSGFLENISEQEQQRRSLETVLDQYPDMINFKDEEGRSALHWAVKNNNPVLAKYLLEQGANVNLQDKNGNTAFHYWVNQADEQMSGLSGVADLMENKQELFNLLKEYSTGFGVTNTDGQTVLHLLAQNRKHEELESILKSGEDKGLDLAAKAQDLDGNTPLHYAALSGNSSLISNLARHSNVNLVNRAGEKAIDLVPLVYKKGEILSLLQPTVQDLPAAREKQRPMFLEEPSFVDLKDTEQQSLSFLDRVKKAWSAFVGWFSGENKQSKYPEELDFESSDFAIVKKDESKGLGLVSIPKNKKPVLMSGLGADSEVSEAEIDFKPKPGHAIHPDFLTGRRF